MELQADLILSYRIRQADRILHSIISSVQVPFILAALRYHLARDVHRIGYHRHEGGFLCHDGTGKENEQQGP